jgi:hypothetical protein
MADQPTRRRWEYHVQSDLDLPPGATSPRMDSRQMAAALNKLDAAGWELVTYGQHQWANASAQEWWVFRRPYQEPSA